MELKKKAKAGRINKQEEVRIKKIHVSTLGCSKNVYDSEILMGQLQRGPVQFVDSPQAADIIIINTCGFIAPAKQESIDAILEAERLKKKDPTKRIIVCGCLSQRYAQELRKEIPSVDAYFGTEEFGNILSFLKLPGNSFPQYLYESRFLSNPKHYAYIKIAEGCNHTCSFCAIPFMRGRYRSRPFEAIVSEAHLLADRGVKELIIISQDTTYYGIDLYKEQKIVGLLRELEKIKRIEWIRLHYLFPTTVPVDLIELMARSEKVVPYLDMPIQHITNRMLRIMRRGGSSRRIQEIFEEARSKIPEVTLRTTLIVGHPGETEWDFHQLKNFVGKMQFERLGVFQYSHEEGTAAFRMENVSEDVKKERFQEIMEIQQQISRDINEHKVGKTIKVLVDEIDFKNKLAIARTPGDSPEIDNEVIIENPCSELRPGILVNVHIIDGTEYELYGKIEE